LHVISKNDFTPGVLKLLEPEITFLKPKLMQDRLLVTFTKIVLTLHEVKCGTSYMYTGHCSNNNASWKVKKKINKNKEMTVERK